MQKEHNVTYYPVYLDVSNRLCVIIGGGEVAARKAQRLVQCGARVTVVGKRLSPEMMAMKEKHAVSHIDADYGIEHLQGAFMAIGATDRDDINELIAGDARSLGILVNIVDDPGHCDFILPSVMNRGDLSISISTGGKSPALAKKLRLEMEERYGSEYVVLLNILGLLREKIVTDGTSSDENRKLFESVLDSDILEAIRNKDHDRALQIIRDLTGKEIILEF
jgi:precorrin-2 dehydrogenase / sirohydrochlorin ferrochelatase